MATLRADADVLKCSANINFHECQLSTLSNNALATWGTEHSGDLDYRVELARRIACTFNNAEQLIIFDDITIQILSLRSDSFANFRGFDRSLLPALWLSTGFRLGGRILVYAPPNSVELHAYLKLKYLIEQHLQRVIRIEILYEHLNGNLIELIQLFQDKPEQYKTLCEEFAQQTSKALYPKYHIDMLKRNMEIITKDVQQSFVFPYDMTELHRSELQKYSDRLSLPDISNNDKARHHFFLKSKGFADLPRLIAVSVDGSLINTYEEYTNVIKRPNIYETVNSPRNIEIFAQAIIEAINQLKHRFNLSAFVKLSSSGAGGWSSMSPSVHSIIYDLEKDQQERLVYLQQYIRATITDELLPEMAVVEELIEPEKRPGDIDADYTVCGFVLSGTFFPTSINLCGTENGAYIEQWTSSLPTGMHDSLASWSKMFRIYSQMVDLEATEFGYRNGIYAGDLFITKDAQLKQRDWNIRRGGRSSPETLIIFGMPNYETKVTLHMRDLGLDGKMNNLELFQTYTHICAQLSKDYGIYTFSSPFGYFGKSSDHGDTLKFQLLIHPKFLVQLDENGEKNHLNRRQHRKKVIELVKSTAMKILPSGLVEY
ncbi:unnamed protein product [Rotaria socialis]|uniref:Uncharacterized protein n=1 Tax=Rotaria socialis TaxID=392032 RepID=A0A820GM84_9BILA|nr:unnamed protein product [Rotaria socialis]CAF3387982.1 unnamed protein product [Rotaria socialis]CAF4280994.1 unnamed protein product [Rotaria socialis]CAF4676171.1 unnamed protein product [Rotaria socialis]